MDKGFIIALIVGAILGFSVLGPKVFKQWKQDVAAMRGSK